MTLTRQRLKRSKQLAGQFAGSNRSRGFDPRWLGNGNDGRLPDEGLALIDEGLALDSNHALGWAWSGSMSQRLGEHKLALQKVDHALRLSPRDAQRHVMFAILAQAHFFREDYDQAASFAEEVIKLEVNQQFQRDCGSWPMRWQGE